MALPQGRKCADIVDREASSAEHIMRAKCRDCAKRSSKQRRNHLRDRLDRNLGALRGPQRTNPLSPADAGWPISRADTERYLESTVFFVDHSKNYARFAASV
jgi:hypothetical protein